MNKEELGQQNRPSNKFLNGHCYCEGVQFIIKFEQKNDGHQSPMVKALIDGTYPNADIGSREILLPCYCHCQSCRRAHSAPLYQICYVVQNCFEITKGKQLIKEFQKKNKDQTKDNQKQDKNGNQLENQAGGIIRAFCQQCGSRIYNKLPKRPSLGIGFFPALLQDDVQHNIPQSISPKIHFHSPQAVLDLQKLNDGVLRFPFK